jgi:nucleoside-diphosphate-sugar epimerase
MKKVLITGMSGLIGGILRSHLEGLGGYRLRALNRRPVEGVESVQADISDLDAIRPAFEGIDVVVHLAAYLGGGDFEGHLSGNLVGAYNVYEAARLAGVKRVVFASSGAAATGFERISPYDAIAEGSYDRVPENFTKITHETTWPSGIYGAAKVWGEAIGRHFADAYGMSVLCVRIGRVNEENRPTSPGEFSRYLSHRDIAQFLQLCIDAPDDLGYDIFFATSNNRWGYRDIEHPRRVLGYEPQDSAEDFR